MPAVDEKPEQGPRISFSGFVVWRRPKAKAEEASQETKARFRSVVEEVREAVQEECQADSTSQRRWRLVRVASPGRFFFGFVR